MVVLMDSSACHPVDLYWILFDIIESFYYSFMVSFTSYFILGLLLFEYMQLSLVRRVGKRKNIKHISLFQQSYIVH